MCWIVSGLEKLHCFELLNGSFRPEAQIRKLHTYMRLQDNLMGREHAGGPSHAESTF
jgi:hypothetical protein